MSKKIRQSLMICICLTVVGAGSYELIADSKTVASPETVDVAAQSVAAETTTPETSPAPAAVDTTNYTPVTKKSETVYVSLDGYGNSTKAQVVNGYKIYGASTITDYGNYTDVTNLTNFVEPIIDGDKVTWNLSDDDGLSEFYYQGDLDMPSLPWTFNITYKLNGVETPIENLAGASGLVETIIEVSPNENVDPYYQNNFFMQLSTSFDMGKCLSVEAPDAVNVSLGATRSITFMTMPGESATYHVYVGTDSYENSGFQMVMAPLQISSLEEISDLKDAKSRIEDAGDATSASIDTIIDSSKEIQSGLSTFSGSLEGIQNSLKAIQAEGNANDSKVDETLTQVNTLSTSLGTLTPHLQTIKEFNADLNESTDTVVNSLSNLKPALEVLKESTTALKEDSSDLSGSLTKIKSASKKVNEQLDGLQSSLTNLSPTLKSLSYALSSASNELDDSSSTAHSINGMLGYLGGSLGGSEDSPIDPSILQGVSGATSTVTNQLTNLNDSLAYVLNESSALSSEMVTINTKLVNVSQSIQDLNGNLMNSVTDVKNGINDIQELLDTTNDVIDQVNLIITSVEKMNTSLSTYQDKVDSAVDDTTSVITTTQDTLTSTTDLLNQIHQSILKTKGDAYDSIYASLNGATEAMDKTSAALGSGDSLKANKDIIKNTIDDEWDRLDDDYNILDIDPDAKPISFVSSENQDIDSLQIILRTPEITVNKTVEVAKEEAVEAELTLWDRIKLIFDKLF